MVVEEKELDEEIKKEADSEEVDLEQMTPEEPELETAEPEAENVEEDTTSETEAAKKKILFWQREKREDKQTSGED